jgi:hypothetical protein
MEDHFLMRSAILVKLASFRGVSKFDIEGQGRDLRMRDHFGRGLAA